MVERGIAGPVPSFAALEDRTTASVDSNADDYVVLRKIRSSSAMPRSRCACRADDIARNFGYLKRLGQEESFNLEGGAL
jgi:hypothetical protein